MAPGSILIVEDDENLRRVTHAELVRSGYKVSSAEDTAQALDILRKEPIDLVISDLNLPDQSGLDLLKRVRSEYPDTTFVIVTAYGTIETALEAVKSGAYDYITKPLHADELKALVCRVFEHHRLVQEVGSLRTTIDQKYGFESIIGNSGVLVKVLERASAVAHTDANVLILGETGTGKELLAKAIHINSPRREQPFAIISCGSIPKELLESELFGHIKGSFTGAFAHKKGKVEMADGGTVFLDEIGEMTLDLQVRVLRLVQEHEIDKIGAHLPQKVNVRIIAATHRDLESRVAEGLFREDLYYRLSVVPLTLPPLRERRDDIPTLVGEFFERNKRKYGKSNLSFPAELMPYFVNYHWPGNVRELENLLERIVLLSSSDQVTQSDLPDKLKGRPPVEKVVKFPVETKGMSLEDVEKELIVQALAKFNGNQTQAANYLGITRQTLMYRIAKHGIKKSYPPKSDEEEEPEESQES